MALPAAVYALGEGAYGFVGEVKPKGELAPAFFAVDRPRPGTVPVYGGLRLDPPAPGAKPVFHALPADLRDPPVTATPLYEFVHGDGKGRTYTTDKAWRGEGLTRAPRSRSAWCGAAQRAWCSRLSDLSG